VLPGADFVDGSTDGRKDLVGHGTTVAGLIAGRNDDSSGVEGLAPRAKILPVRVLDARNRYSDAADVAKGVRWAVDHGASVINLSLGGQAHSDALADAISYAALRDVVVIACTGNINPGGTAPADVWYPAREPGVVAVAGLAADDGLDPAAAGAAGGAGGSAGGQLWPGSLTGPQTVLAAPAVNLLGARPGGYWRVQGTSFAAPLVSAAAALVRARYPSMNAANVINRLIATAHDLGPPGRDDQYGYGEVNPVAAVQFDVSTVESNPLVAGTVGGGSVTEPAEQVTAPVGGGAPPFETAQAAAPVPSSPSSLADAGAVTEQGRVYVAIGVAVMALLFAGMLLILRRRAWP
jgi:subtilisin family serine protease